VSNLSQHVVLMNILTLKGLSVLLANLVSPWILREMDVFSLFLLAELMNILMLLELNVLLVKLVLLLIH
jgi:hypothetical protein